MQSEALKPVAWRVKDYADDYFATTSEEMADIYRSNGQLVEPLYTRPSEDLAAHVPGLVEALECIERMRLFPDDKVNRTTLIAATQLARAALQTVGVSRG